MAALFTGADSHGHLPTAGADNSNLPGMGGLFNTTNSHLYHYAGNNPVRYTNPDGWAYTIRVCIDMRPNHLRYKYYFRATNKWEQSSEVIVSTAVSYNVPYISSSSITFKHWIDDEKLIEEQKQSVDYASIALDSVSFAGNLNFSKKLTILGNLATGIGVIQSVLKIRDIWKDEKRFLIEDICSLELQEYLCSTSHENVASLYLYAKEAINNMLSNGEITVSQDKNALIPWTINNKKSFDALKEELKLKRIQLEQ